MDRRRVGPSDQEGQGRRSAGRERRQDRRVVTVDNVNRPVRGRFLRSRQLKRGRRGRQVEGRHRDRDEELQIYGSLAAAGAQAGVVTRDGRPCMPFKVRVDRRTDAMVVRRPVILQMRVHQRRADGAERDGEREPKRREPADHGIIVRDRSHPVKDFALSRFIIVIHAGASRRDGARVLVRRRFLPRPRCD